MYAYKYYKKYKISNILLKYSIHEKTRPHFGILGQYEAGLCGHRDVHSMMWTSSSRFWRAEKLEKWPFGFANSPAKFH